MIKDATVTARLMSLFPFLQGAPAPFIETFFAHGSLVTLEAGNHVCLEGRECMHLALVVEGSARVYKLGDNGREITLYRVGEGESCILTASCILSNIPFPAFAVAETAVTAVVIPAPRVTGWLAEWAVWRNYLFGLVAQRLSNVISVVEEVVFRRMDQRIASYLLEYGTPAGEALSVTHQQIASDLGTSREVVSRILKDFESDQLIQLSRGALQLLDPVVLQQRAENR